MRKDAGYPPLVTPSSQIVGTQAVFNVLMGRYKVLTGEFADLMLGLLRRDASGRATPSVIELAAKQAKKDADHRPAGRPAEAGMGRAARRRAGAEGMQRHRRGRPDLRDVPAGGAEVLRDARAGTEEPGQGSGGEPRRGRRAGRSAARPTTARAGARPRHLRRQVQRQDAQGDRRSRRESRPGKDRSRHAPSKQVDGGA